MPTNPNRCPQIGLFIIAVVLGITGVSAAGDIFYVKAGAAGDTGSSWDEAFGTLQEALDVVNNGDEIWVAQGTYYPTAEEGGTGERYKTFQMRNGVAIYGGFPDTGTSDWNDRAPDQYETILSGDIGTPGDLNDNCYNVFYHPSGINLDFSAILDGFTITGGNADGESPHDSGGGMFNTNCTPIIINCTFSNNLADFGAGIFNYISNPLIIHCSFSDNSAAFGAGIYSYYNSNPTVSNCTFSNNSVDVIGGGICNLSSNSTIINCIFSSNTAYSGGGMASGNSNSTVTNCIFYSNSADNYGGGMYNDDSDPVVTNCIFWSNDAASAGPQIYDQGISSPTITYSDIQGGYPGVGNIDADPLFADADGADDINGTQDDDLKLLAGSPCIDAGNNSAVPESMGTDLAGRHRFIDDPATNDTGNGESPIVDMGVYEKGKIIIYVNSIASGDNNGSSWEDALVSLQDGLDLTIIGDEIWVAAGTYYPTVEVSDTSDRYKTFQMKNGVSLYGGFPAAGTPTMNNRAPGWHKTILSGDIGAVGDHSDNCYHVFYHPSGTNVDSSAILDGFTITAGNAVGGYPHDSGGGMYNYQCDPNITNCTFRDNSANYGGGMYNSENSNPTITNCILTGNTAQYSGGGMYNLESSPTIINSNFCGNSADNSGGGTYNSESSPTLTNCILWDNPATGQGPQIYNHGVGAAAVTYSDVQGGYTGIGNIDVDPLFVDADGTDDTYGTEDDDLRLSYGSGCLDAGDNYAVPETVVTDINGRLRFTDDPATDDTGNGIPPIVDMGAYEGAFRTVAIEADNPVVMISVSNGDDIEGTIFIRLYADEAPVTVANFLAYVADGFYDGLIFHRVINNFMIQGGGFDTTLSYVNPTYDPIENESTNGLSNLRGTIAMARTAVPDSATSQFYINHVDNLFLDRAYPSGDGYGYCVFGEVLSGMEVVDAIAATLTDDAYSDTGGWMGDVPQTTVVIERVVAFADGSDDFGDEAYFGGEMGMVRSYRGQGNLAGLGYMQRFSQQQMFGINCLRMEETDIAQGNGDGFYMMVARDITERGWGFQMADDGEILIDAHSTGEIISFDEIAGMQFRLVNGNYSEGMIVDLGDGETEVIESIEEGVILVKRMAGGDVMGWRYYDETAGLVLDLDNPEGALDGDGWFLAQDSDIADLTISKAKFQRGKTTGTDSFNVSSVAAVFPTEQQTDTATAMFLRVGPWSTTIDTEAEGWKDSSSGSSYKGIIDGASVKFTAKDKTLLFTIQAKNVDLTGLNHPVVVEIGLGSYYAQGTISEDVAKGITLQFMSSVADFMAITPGKVKFKRNLKKDNADSLTLQGTIALEGGVNGLDGVGQMDLDWGNFRDWIPAGKLVSAGNGKYRYKKEKSFEGTISSAQFDLGKSTFKITIKNAAIGEQANPAVFRLRFGSFWQEVSVDY